MKIGIIADTHGYFSPELISCFQSVELIIHAGDIGSMTVVNSLENCAKLEAIRGNMDRDRTWDEFPDEKLINVLDLRILIVHRLPYDYKKIAKENDIDILIYGHTHVAEVISRDDLLLINPGSAGKISLNKTVVIMEVGDKKEISTKVIKLK